METAKENDYKIGPNLWAGLRQVLSGNSIALVGTPDQVADRIIEFVELGFDKILLRGFPHLETAAVVPADRADTLDVAVRQGAARRGRDRAKRRLLDEVAVLVEAGEHLLHDSVAVASRGAGVEVIGESEPDEVLHDQPVVAVN